MSNKTQPHRWYSSKSAGDHQGLVSEEDTGRTVAFTQDIKDRFLVAAAPEMQEALIAVDDFLLGFKEDELPDDLRRMVASALSNSKES